jgi:hypothetical protein
MAKTNPAPTPAPTPAPAARVEAALLRDCVFGKIGAVVLLSPADAAAGKEQGMLDMHPDAIAHAKANAPA